MEAGLLLYGGRQRKRLQSMVMVNPGPMEAVALPVTVNLLMEAGRLERLTGLMD